MNSNNDVLSKHQAESSLTQHQPQESTHSLQAYCDSIQCYWKALRFLTLTNCIVFK